MLGGEREHCAEVGVDHRHRADCHGRDRLISPGQLPMAGVWRLHRVVMGGDLGLSAQTAARRRSGQQGGEFVLTVRLPLDGSVE